MPNHRYDKPSPGNKHGFTTKQHTLPAESIRRFANQDGLVHLVDKVRNKARWVRPEDQFFCAKRAWDERAEKGFGKRIEDNFQDLAHRLCSGLQQRLTLSDNDAVSSFMALWRARVDVWYRPPQAGKSNLLQGEKLTLEQEETLESKGYIFVRNDGKIPDRFMGSVSIQSKLAQFARQHGRLTWSVLHSPEIELCVSDNPKILLVPLNPRLCLMNGFPAGELTTMQAAKLNRRMIEDSLSYFFARDIEKCAFSNVHFLNGLTDDQ